VRRLGLHTANSPDLGVEEQRAPFQLGLRQVAAEVDDVAQTHAAQQHRLVVAEALREAARLTIGCVGLIELGLNSPHASQAHPDDNGVTHAQPVACDVEQRQQRVFGFLETRFLLEKQRVGDQGRGQQANVALAMRFPSRPHDAAQMRGFGAFTCQLGAVALGGGPLVAKDVGRGWLAVGGEKIDKPQRQESALPEPHIRGCGRLVGNALEKDGVW